MTQPSSPSILDFNTPRRPPSVAARQLSTWQTNACATTNDGWAGLLAQPVTLKAGRIEPVQYHAALRNLPEDGLGVYFSIGETLLPSMLVISARQVQGLIADLLDLPGEEWPAPAAISAAEEAMLELLFQKLAECLGDAWPESQPLRCQYLETTSKPQRTRLFPMGAALFSLTVTFVSRFGEEACTWLMLKEETERLLLEHFGEIEPEDRGFHPDLLALTEKVPLEITVQLGQVELSMSQASALAVGDVLILDQYVARPLVAYVQGEPKWAGKPLRIGSRQAFEVTRLVDSSTLSTLQLTGGMDIADSA